MRSPDFGMRNGGPDQRRRRVLRASAFQVLWALLLVYLILLGLAFLFGRQVGYDISLGVCGGLAALVTTAFLAISPRSGVRLSPLPLPEK